MKATATLEILDEVNVRFRQLDAGTMKRCSAKLALYAENYRHTPSFKIGRWDGKIRLFSASTGHTYFRLLDLILPEIESNYDLELIDHRRDYSGLLNQIEYVTADMFSHLVWPPGHNNAGEPIMLRDYQIEAANCCIGAGSGTMSMGTAGGKSLTVAALASRYMVVGNVVVVVPSIDLVIQTRSTFRTVGIDCGIWYGLEKDRKPVTMSTWQSLDGWDELFDGTNTFIVDETQGARGKILGEILAGPAANVPFRFGCTGTLPPNELAQAQIKGVIGPPIYIKTIKTLQDEGYLSEGKIEQIELNDRNNIRYPRRIGIDENGKAKTIWGHDEYLDEIKWMHKDPDRMEWIHEFIVGMSELGKTLILVQHHEYHEKLTEMFPDAIAVTGKIPVPKREPLWNRFRGAENLAICTSGIGATGIDVPNIRYIIGIEMGKSLIKVMQTLGRGLRKTKTKTFLDLFDLHGNAKMSKRHANERKRMFEEAGQTVTRTQVDYL